METILPGLSRMANWHPLFVHFPIAFWIGALLFELAAQARRNDEWHRTAARLLYLGVLFAFVAALTGLYAEGAVDPRAYDTLQTHKLMMMATTGVAVALAALVGFRREALSPGLRKLFLAGLLVLATMLVLGADRGAQLVYQYGTAVDWSTAVPQK